MKKSPAARGVRGSRNDNGATTWQGRSKECKKRENISKHADLVNGNTTHRAHDHAVCTRARRIEADGTHPVGVYICREGTNPKSQAFAEGLLRSLLTSALLPAALTLRVWDGADANHTRATNMQECNKATKAAMKT